MVGGEEPRPTLSRVRGSQHCCYQAGVLACVSQLTGMLGLAQEGGEGRSGTGTPSGQKAVSCWEL